MQATVPVLSLVIQATLSDHAKVCNFQCISVRALQEYNHYYTEAFVALVGL